MIKQEYFKNKSRPDFEKIYRKDIKAQKKLKFL